MQKISKNQKIRFKSKKSDLNQKISFFRFFIKDHDFSNPVAFDNTLSKCGVENKKLTWYATCEFHLVGQSWISLCSGAPSCFWTFNSSPLASGLRLKWLTIFLAFWIILGNSDTDRFANAPLTHSCRVWAMHGRHFCTGSWGMDFLVFAPLSVTACSLAISRCHSSARLVSSCDIYSAVWLPGAGRTARHRLYMVKLLSSQCAVRPMYDWLADDVHMSVVIETVSALLIFSATSDLTASYFPEIRFDDSACLVGSL